MSVKSITTIGLLASSRGYAIRVYRDGTITEAFKRHCDIKERLAEYPLLDEEDYSQREYEATFDNIKQASSSYDRDHWPEHWASELYSWFYEHDQSAIENRDDQGGWPSNEQLMAAIADLSWHVEV